ncbi:MAG: hypothetical protein L7F78_12565 [Syntrophales bacterium LBB04]|nr:hypothetical protein [Syntrophales bacterium LBB04]
MMSIADIEKITKVLASMTQFELALSDFYKQCADVWPDDQTFWQNLARAEVRHAENIQKMREIITDKQERFEAGRLFNVIALDTAMAGLKDNNSRLTAKIFTREKMLIMARDIENSILESHYAEIVKTVDIEYQTLMKGIISQTYEHRKIIQEKIDKIKSTA